MCFWRWAESNRRPTCLHIEGITTILKARPRRHAYIHHMLQGILLL
jgi:hypothetical protein